MKRKGSYIIDNEGRTLILRGVNLGGSSKIPAAPGKPASVSFVGRPFPLEEADEHFGNLAKWGLTFIRLIVTWEALEHAGPGVYDEAYLDYLEKLLFAAEKRGISVLMDPHQDVWSRWTGGDGAPAWTLEKLGMDLEKLDAAGAAVTPQHYAEINSGKNYPQMIWPVNYSLYAAATMFTLFFGGNYFAPQVKIEGKSAQDFLQGSYIKAFTRCFERLKHCKAISSWDIMNEPHPGFIAYGDLRRLENVTLAKGPVPSPFQAMLAASGASVRVPVYTPWLKDWKVVGFKTINPGALSLFKEGYSCPWKQAGIWEAEGQGGRLIKPGHFSSFEGRLVRFTDDFLKPFFIRSMKAMDEVEKRLLFFIEGIPHKENPVWNADDPQNTVNAFHHYDGFTLFTKGFRPWLTLDPYTGRIILGKKKTAAHYSAKLAEARAWAREKMGGMPCFLGEFGVPFDLNNKKAYKTGDYGAHEAALRLYYDGVDENLLGSTIWNYTADNTNEDGDHWNGEDLSIVTRAITSATGGGVMGAAERINGGAAGAAGKPDGGGVMGAAEKPDGGAQGAAGKPDGGGVMGAAGAAGKPDGGVQGTTEKPGGGGAQGAAEKPGDGAAEKPHGHKSVPRAKRGWLRPYPMATAGVPLVFKWSSEGKAAFYFRFRTDPAIEAPTEIFLPSEYFGEEPLITVKTAGENSSLQADYKLEDQRLFIYNGGYACEVEVWVKYR